MKSVDEVWGLLRGEVSPCDAVGIPLAEASGCILREDVFAPEDQPAFDRSAVDGFVVRTDDPTENFRIVGEILAGDGQARNLAHGEAWRIATGAMVPDGGEVVVLESSEESGGLVRFSQRGRDHVRRRGEDAQKGDVVMRAGAELGAGAVGLLASLGCVRPRVTRSIGVLHIATGNEIVDAAERPSTGQVRDSNSPLVAAWARARGLRLLQNRVAEDADALRRAIEGSRDLLLVSGGASVGGHDCTGDVLAAAGFRMLVTKVAVRPGKPLIIGRRDEEWAFGLPGNPLSHFVCLNVFLDAALAAMRGGPHAPILWQRTVTSAIAGNPRETWWPAKEEADGLHPLPWTSSGDLTALASANALVRVPASGLAAGEEAGFIRTG